MSTLLLRLAGPMQSWGASSRFKKLATEREPTKSGVVGLIAAALGRRRNEDISDLSALRFGVRVDQPGVLLRDYHTAHNPNDAKLSFISERYYLCDAIFVVGFESDNELLLKEIKAALQSPYFPLYLGRRSCPPTGKIVLDLTKLPLKEALELQEWQAQGWYMKKRQHESDVNLEIVTDVSFETPNSYVKRDMPISFSDEFRRYGFRIQSSDVKGVTIENSYKPQAAAELSETILIKHETEHDPYLALEVSDVSVES